MVDGLGMAARRRLPADMRMQCRPRREPGCHVLVRSPALAGGRTWPAARWGEPAQCAALFRVDQFADRRDLTAQLVVRGDLARDLVAGVQDRGVVAPAQL